MQPETNTRSTKDASETRPRPIGSTSTLPNTQTKKHFITSKNPTKSKVFHWAKTSSSDRSVCFTQLQQTQWLRVLSPGIRGHSWQWGHAPDVNPKMVWSENHGEYQSWDPSGLCLHFLSPVFFFTSKFSPGHVAWWECLLIMGWLKKKKKKVKIQIAWLRSKTQVYFSKQRHEIYYAPHLKRAKKFTRRNHSYFCWNDNGMSLNYPAQDEL